MWCWTTVNSVNTKSLTTYACCWTTVKKGCHTKSLSKYVVEVSPYKTRVYFSLSDQFFNKHFTPALLLVQGFPHLSRYAIEGPQWADIGPLLDPPNKGRKRSGTNRWRHSHVTEDISRGHTRYLSYHPNLHITEDISWGHTRYLSRHPNLHVTEDISWGHTRYLSHHPNLHVTEDILWGHTRYLSHQLKLHVTEDISWGHTRYLSHHPNLHVTENISWGHTRYLSHHPNLHVTEEVTRSQ